VINLNWRWGGCSKNPACKEGYVHVPEYWEKSRKPVTRWPVMGPFGYVTDGWQAHRQTQEKFPKFQWNCTAAFPCRKLFYLAGGENGLSYKSEYVNWDTKQDCHALRSLLYSVCFIQRWLAYTPTEASKRMFNFVGPDASQLIICNYCC